MDKQFDDNSKPRSGVVSRREALRIVGAGVAGGLLACSGIGRAKATTNDGSVKASSSGPYLVVGSWVNNKVVRYDEQTGAFVDQIDPHNDSDLTDPYGGVFGPDHNLYVSSNTFLLKNRPPGVIQYNGPTGAFQRLIVHPTITSPRGVLFGRDGNLYVANGNTAAQGDPASVLRFDGTTGAFIDHFVALDSGGLEHPTYMVFGPDGDLYVGAGHLGAILRYDGATGASRGDFVSAISTGLPGPGVSAFPVGMAFGPDGNLYVSNFRLFLSSNGPFYPDLLPPGAVLRYQGPFGANPGAFMDTFVPAGSGGLSTPWGLLFGPNGDLFVASCVQDNKLTAEGGMNQVLRYDGTTGAPLGAFIVPGNGGLKSPSFLMFSETDPTSLNYKL